jgi:hypothetical protein
MIVRARTGFTQEFLRPLAEARGCAFPEVWVPTRVMVYVALLCEWLYKIAGVPPFLTRAEVYKVGVTHTFTPQKAREHFGYDPTINSQRGAELLALHYGYEKLVCISV